MHVQHKQKHKDNCYFMKHIYRVDILKLCNFCREIREGEVNMV